MSGPNAVRIKRPRDALAPDTLIVEPSSKKHKAHLSPIELRYVRQKDGSLQSDHNGENGGVTRRSLETKGAESTTIPHGRRTFHLSVPTPGSPGGSIRKRKASSDGIATFVEKKKRSRDFSRVANENERLASENLLSQQQQQQQQQNLQPLKRPGKSAAVQVAPAAFVRDEKVDERADETARVVSTANLLHQFALDEAAREATPAKIAVPKLSGRRSKEVHRQRVSLNDVQMHDRDAGGEGSEGEEKDYVYDTYILAPLSRSPDAEQVEALPDLGNVGYLVISEEDQAVWETYIEDEPSDKDWDSDENDENAEDWYGADYPDDELASDDEFGRNAYGYRAHGASDDEDWGDEAPSWSDDEYDRQMHPWRTRAAGHARNHMETGEGGDEMH